MAKNKKTLDELLQEAIVKDAPYEVPGNWVKSNLNSIVKFEKGKKPKILIDEYKENAIPYITIKCFESNKPDQYTFLSETSKICEKDDIIIVWDGARAGLVGMGAYGALGSTLCKVKYDKLNKKYMYYYFLGKYDLINVNTKGTGIPHVNPHFLQTLMIPIPPLKEQERIVQKIEGLFEKLDKAKKLIEEVREDFEKRKASILEKAFRGELTEKWREENKYTLESLKELLLKQNKLIKKGFSYDKAIEIYNIPIEWEWIKLKDICEKFKYGTSKKSIKEGKVPVLRMGNLQNGKINWSDLVYTNDENDILKYELKEGDILFNRTNSPELVGKTSIYDGLVQSIYAGYLIRIRVLNSIDSKYVNYFMNSIIAKRICMEVKTDGVSQSNINAEKLGQFDIPICSLEEQKEIVRILDKLLDEENKIEKLTNLENQIELTKKSILAKAFRGELGTNDPSEESAMELLKEVLQEKL
ncbi:restriction endonuclease subunit S [Clostridium novyi]|uniref:restriction endonuclease subunit S n=1 Tax=Clostridium novyi TaxID=1542 RepID=UPI0004D77B89|nr:restriction endonuclease subunit S [Clostridium novyi]KEI13333.1 hypothetical protein Z958_03730 [Clostridium novyi B str. NCTC 9691]